MKEFLVAFMIQLGWLHTPPDGLMPAWGSLTYYDVVEQDFQSFPELMGENGLVLVFVSSNCPYVTHYESRIQEIAVHAKANGIHVALVNSNNTVGRHIESIDHMRKESARIGIQYISDQSKQISKAFEVKRNPEVVILGASKYFPKVYQGAIDDSPLMSGGATKNYVIPVLDQLVKGEEPEFSSNSAVGCAIR